MGYRHPPGCQSPFSPSRRRRASFVDFVVIRRSRLREAHGIPSHVIVQGIVVNPPVSSDADGVYLAALDHAAHALGIALEMARHGADQ